MAVGNIEYKKILNDEDWTPEKRKDLYVSRLDSPFVKQTPVETTPPLMSSVDAKAVISNRQLKQDVVEENDEQDVEAEVVAETTPVYTYTGMPMTLDIPQSNTTFTNNEDFVHKMTNVYKKALIQRGYNPEFAKYIVAQDGLESGWGKHQAGKNNLGGIKGKGTAKQTKEWDGSKMITITDSFRDFNSLEDYVNYKIDLVGNKRYNVFAYSPEEYFNRVKAGGYATDPDYVKKMNSVLKTVEKYV